MGLKTGSEKAKYVRIKDGFFFLSTDMENPYTDLEGTLVDVYFRDDEFNGQTIRKVNLVLEDDSDRYILSFPFESSYTSTLVGFLKNANLDEVLSLSIKVNEYKDKAGEAKTKRAILVSQNGKWLKSFYGKDKDEQLPEIKQVRINKKLVWDKTELLDKVEDIILRELKPLLLKDREQVTTHSYVRVDKTQKKADLPWEAKVPEIEDNDYSDGEGEDLPF